MKARGNEPKMSHMDAAGLHASVGPLEFPVPNSTQFGTSVAAEQRRCKRGKIQFPARNVQFGFRSEGILQAQAEETR